MGLSMDRILGLLLRKICQGDNVFRRGDLVIFPEYM
jgi:hypothetical protein